MRHRTRKACYELLAEVLVYPEDRVQGRIQALARVVERAAAEDVRTPLLALLAAPEVEDCEAYLGTLELVPACPLYLGHYLFDEPESCRGAGSSGRNRYMIEIAGIYRHFGLELTGREVPDFLPVVLEFLSLSLDRPDRNRTGLREIFIHRYVAPALRPMRERFREQARAWAPALDALNALLASERPAPRRTADRNELGRGRRQLPVLQREAQP